MASLKYALALCALFLVAAQAWEGYDLTLQTRVKSECPDINANSGCNTGSCANGGLIGRFFIHLPGNCKYKNDQPYKSNNCVDTKGNDGVFSFEIADIPSCCRKCKTVAGCLNWQYLQREAKSPAGLCLIYTKDKLKCHNGANQFQLTVVGSKCRKPNVINDPHLTGAHGTQFDFSGLPQKSFCLLTDRNLHMNMKLGGYLDSRTASATSFVEGKAVRTWIQEVGMVWTVNGEEHKLRMKAREGKENGRGEGFLALAEVDAVSLPRMQVGDELRLAGGLVIKFEANEQSGPYEVDFYRVKIDGVIDLDMRLRVANPLLQTSTEAFAHFNLGINDIKRTPAIHGVLGQTYREGREERSAEFAQVVARLHEAVAADSALGQGFLDGTPADYVSSNVLSTDCRYSGYGGQTLPTFAE